MGPAFGGGPLDRGAGLTYEGLVAWDPSEREYLEAKFGKGPAWSRAVTTAQVVYTHESMNVYAMLVRYVIAKTNGDQKEHQLVPIKKIVTIRLGEDCQMPSKSALAGGTMDGSQGAPVGGSPLPMPMPGAAASSGYPSSGYPGTGSGQTGYDPTTPFAVSTLGGGGAGGGYGGGGYGGGPRRSPMATTGPTESGASGDRGSQPPDGYNRYVDDEGYAVTDPAQQPYAEFRMLPVIMRFIMDQRRLPEVLANCVDSPLPIEVKQWNMRDPNAPERSAASPEGGPTRSGPMGSQKTYPGATTKGYPGSTSGVRPMGGAFGAAVAPGEATFGGEVELGPYDMEIEIKGIIYIYNPPDATKVGTGVAATAQVDADGKQPEPAEKAKAVVEPVNTPAKPEPNEKPAEKAAEPAEKQAPMPVDAGKAPPAPKS
jgi:hypothetical protein